MSFAESKTEIERAEKTLEKAWKSLALLCFYKGRGYISEYLDKKLNEVQRSDDFVSSKQNMSLKLRVAKSCMEEGIVLSELPYADYKNNIMTIRQKPKGVKK